jgi:D-proline reductase (dithiol) PrdB
MASLSELPLKYRVLLRMYQYRRLDWAPGSVLRKPLATARIAVVTTAGLYLPNQPPFDETVRGGDYSYRVIRDDVDLSDLRIGQRSDAFDPSGSKADKNVALPLDRLHELARERVIGHLAPRHFSFMGSISAPGRLISETAPAVAAMLREDQVDGVLLTPV